MKVIFITSEESFEKVRNAEEDKIVLFFLKDIDFKNKPFTPIDKEGKDVVIYGNEHNIFNLRINNPFERYNGLFSKVNNLKVNDLRIVQSSIISNEVAGTLAGKVEKDLTVKGSLIFTNINADSIVGSLAGSAGNVKVENTRINGNYSARGMIGGLVGMCDTIEQKDVVFNFYDYSISGEKDTFDYSSAYIGSEVEEELTMKLKPLMKKKETFYIE